MFFVYTHCFVYVCLIFNLVSMKIYHKFLLYQNKWIHPYTRIILGGVTYIAYPASILLIMGVVYEHGFTISEHEASQLQTLYRFVWGVFLSEVTLRLLLEYRDTKRTFKKLTWILIALLLPYPYPCHFS